MEGRVRGRVDCLCLKKNKFYVAFQLTVTFAELDIFRALDKREYLMIIRDSICY